MIYMLLALFGILFVELFLYFNLRTQIASIITLSREAVTVLLSSTIEDHDKEVFIRRRSLELLKVTTAFTVKFLLIFFVIYLVYLLCTAMIPESKEALNDSLFSVSDLAILTGTTMCYLWVRNIVRKEL